MINGDTTASSGVGWRRIVTAAILPPLFLGLAACGQTSTGDGRSADGGEPSFSGPYAAEFTRTYEQAPTDLARNILKDGRITQAEVQEIYNAYNTCLEPYGLQASWSVDQGETVGQYRGTLSDEKQFEIMDDCQATTYAGAVSSLYATMSRNPDNIDQETLARKTYQCYVKYDLLPSPISEDEYMSATYDGQPNPNYKYDGESEKGRQFWACNQDPLHQ